MNNFIEKNMNKKKMYSDELWQREYGDMIIIKNAEIKKLQNIVANKEESVQGNIRVFC